MGEVQLQMDLVVEHVLAERAAEHGLHRVLGHGVHPQPVHIRVAVLAIWALIHLQSKTDESRDCDSRYLPLSVQLDCNSAGPSPATSYRLSSFSSSSYFILAFGTYETNYQLVGSSSLPARTWSPLKFLTI